MKNLKFINILILITTMLIAEEKTWATTTFDYYWNLGLNRIRFREPVNFTPFEARIGYLTYGGSDYWDNASTTLGEISPVALDSINNSFNYLEPASARSLVFIEVDFIRTNLPNLLLNKIGWSQNFLDIQTGLGYRYIHSISEPEFPEYWRNTLPNNQNPGTLFFKPRIHDFNINTSIDYQILEKIRAFFYYSLGYSFGTIYEYSGTGSYLNCNGISEGVGLGIRYIKKMKKYNFNLIYSLEYRLHRTYINHVEDPSAISYIDELDMYSKGLILSIGTIFGGNKTSADYSFLKMLNEKYISAETGFEKYISSNKPQPRKKLANKMLNFTRIQIPYEQYQYGLKNQSLNNIDSAIYWFDESAKTANNDLLFEINTHRKDLAIMLIDSVSIYKNNLSFDEAEKIIQKAKKLADNYYYVNEMLSNLYLEKGDALKKVGNYNKAYEYYNKAKKTYPDSNIKLIEKYYVLANELIEKGNLALKNNEYSLAIELLSFASDINPDKKEELSDLIDKIYTKLTKKEAEEIKRKIKKVVEKKKLEIKNSIHKKILIGMSANEVMDILGNPTIKDAMEKGERKYELWTYKYPNKIKKIYLEDNFVVKVE